jgi:hypothetical protein
VHELEKTGFLAQYPNNSYFFGGKECEEGGANVITITRV